MPMKIMLDSGTFDPKAVAVLLKAFDGVVADLELRTDAEREKAAKIIVWLATGQEDIEAAKLRAGAVASMRNVKRWRRPF